MVKFFKLKRELKRILRKPQEISGDLVTFLFGTAYYDLVLARQRVEFDGQQRDSAKAAVYLIYPSFGLKPSHLRALRYLASKNYSTVVVSNLKLGKEDRSRVLEHCTKYIERPNFGYDFGGYRDGILKVLDVKSDLDWIVLLNDSTWFPICENADWLEEVEERGLDFCAAASNFGVPRVDPESFRELRFDYSSRRRNFHYTSFALAFGKKVISDPDFVSFWRRLQLTNKKKRTVKRGEIGLTRWILTKDYSHASTLDICGLELSLQKLSHDQIQGVAKHLIIPEDNRLAVTAASVLVDIENVSRADLEKLILTAVSRQGAAYALAYYNILIIGFPFLKKSPIWLNKGSSEITVSVLDQIGSRAALEAKQEALELRVKLLKS